MSHDETTPTPGSSTGSTSPTGPPATGPERHLDQERRELVAAARHAVLRGADTGGSDDATAGPGVPDAMRRAVAALTWRAAGADRDLGELDPGEAGGPALGSATAMPGEQAALAFATTMAREPAILRRQDIDDLRSAGLEPAQIVTIAQVIGFSAFEVRLEALARALDRDPEQPLPEEDLTPAPQDLPHPRTRFAMRGWTGWLPLGGRDEDFPVKDNQKPNDYYRVLVHDQEALTHRTALYDALLRGDGESSVEQREMAALAVSLSTPCDFCASVHGRRHFLAGRDPRSSVELDHGGPQAVSDPVQRAIARFGPALGAVEPDVPVRPVQLLRAHGLSDRAIAEIGAVAAMFAWANRLMTGLGQATD